jgi:hypothetical protein
MAAPLVEAIEFLKDFGFFDVVLPFLLIFAVTFAVLEKTEIFGKDKKNINSMIAFVMGLLFVTVPKVVSVIKESLPNIGVMLIVLMSFMMLVGFFVSSKDGKHFFEENKFLKVIFIMVVLVGTTIIFLDAIGWWDDIWSGAGGFWSSTAGVTIVFLAIIVGAILFIARDKSGGNSSE